MYRIVLFVLLLCSIAATAPAGDQKVIELVDGSVITGEIISLNSGVYTIKTDSLGTITITESRVKEIRQKSTASQSQDAPSAAQIQSLQQRMTSDKEIMALIQSLQDDPEFRKALEDPEVQRAVTSGDVPALTANPKFMNLLNHSAVQEIKKKVGE